MSWKDNWNQIDELCPHCNNVVKPAKGLNKQNFKRLISLKVKFSDFLVLFILAMLLFGAWAYNRDTKECRYLVNNFDTLCIQRAAEINKAYEGVPNNTLVLIPFMNETIEENETILNDTIELNETIVNQTINVSITINTSSNEGLLTNSS
jgi:hypothetical protein